MAKFSKITPDIAKLILKGDLSDREISRRSKLLGTPVSHVTIRAYRLDNSDRIGTSSNANPDDVDDAERARRIHDAAFDLAMENRGNSAKFRQYADVWMKAANLIDISLTGEDKIKKKVQSWSDEDLRAEMVDAIVRIAVRSYTRNLSYPDLPECIDGGDELVVCEPGFTRVALNEERARNYLAHHLAVVMSGSLPESIGTPYTKTGPLNT